MRTLKTHWTREDVKDFGQYQGLELPPIIVLYFANTLYFLARHNALNSLHLYRLNVSDDMSSALGLSVT